MAKIHGSRGATPRSQAHRLGDQWGPWILGGMVFYGAMVGFVLANYDTVGLFGIIALVAVLVGAVWGANTFLNRYAAAMQKERLAYLRGARAEELVGWLLEDLADGWHVFHDLPIQDSQDHNHVVVGPGGLFCISTKSTRGLFSKGPGGELLCNNRPTKLADQALGQAIMLKERLCALMGADSLWINSVLAVPFAWIEVSGPHRNVIIVHQESLIDTFERVPQRLTEQQVKAHVKALEMLETSTRGVVHAEPKAGFSPEQEGREDADSARTG